MNELENETSLDSALTRRQLLKAAAGGITFLALAPVGKGLFAATLPALAAEPALPLFIALPYIQPGGGNGKLVQGQESLVVAWQTNGVPAKYVVEYGKEQPLDRTAEIKQKTRWSGDKADGEQRLNFAATLSGLDLNTRYHYRVRLNGRPLLEGYFTTRKPRGVKTRFVSFGDNSFGEVSDRAIAYQAYKARPDFVMNTGDNVYENGLDNEYARYFFPVYNAEAPGPRTGAPLLRSVPFYTVIANHDVHDKGPVGPVADFAKNPDSLAYFTNMYLPTNGLDATHTTPAIGPDATLAKFKECADGRFPRMANYSYDYGDAHFLCLDSNIYVDPTDAKLQAWIEADLKAADAVWKFVVYHHPAFNVGDDHFAEQHMRVLSPLFEQQGVDIVLHGHEHTYQRTRPFRFAPADLSRAKAINTKDRLVPGTFTIDPHFDGKTVTKPDGIVYLVTGAGGKHLYDPESNENPQKWRHPEDNNADYVVRFVSDRHSLTVVEMDARSLLFTQIDEWGAEIDRFTVTKA